MNDEGVAQCAVANILHAAQHRNGCVETLASPDTKQHCSFGRTRSLKPEHVSKQNPNERAARKRETSVVSCRVVSRVGTRSEPKHTEGTRTRTLTIKDPDSTNRHERESENKDRSQTSSFFPYNSQTGARVGAPSS